MNKEQLRNTIWKTQEVEGVGYSDLEFALVREAGRITGRTVIATTVHPLQVTGEEIPFASHDIPLDLIVTPDEVIEPNTGYRRPEGLQPELLSEQYKKEIPALEGI